jgi:hypothetical protein
MDQVSISNWISDSDFVDSDSCGLRVLFTVDSRFLILQFVHVFRITLNGMKTDHACDQESLMVSWTNLFTYIFPIFFRSSFLLKNIFLNKAK